MIAVRWCRRRRSKPVAEGVSRGLRRREAEARCAELTVIDSDDAADARASSRPWCARSNSSCRRSCSIARDVARSPRAAPPATSVVTTRWRGGSSRSVRDAGVVDARVGIADGNLAAGLAARAADTLVVPRGESAVFLAPWSVGVLAPHVAGGPELADLLARLGLRTLGAFAEFPEPSVLGRFGIPGVQAHRLARGESSSGSVPAALPPELVETIEFDPPAEHVDEAAFAAKSLADRLLGRLDELGLSCTRVIVEAETEHGERLARCWRHDGSLTPATLVDAGAVAARRLAHRDRGHHAVASGARRGRARHRSPARVLGRRSRGRRPRRRVRSHGCKGCSGPSRWSPRSPSADGRPRSGCVGCRGARTRSSVRARSRLPVRARSRLPVRARSRRRRGRGRFPGRHRRASSIRRTPPISSTPTGRRSP